MRISLVALAVTLAGVQVVSSAAAGRIGGVQVPRSLVRSPAPAEAFDEAHHPDPDLPTFRIDAANRAAARSEGPRDRDQTARLPRRFEIDARPKGGNRSD